MLLLTLSIEQSVYPGSVFLPDILPYERPEIVTRSVTNGWGSLFSSSELSILLRQLIIPPALAQPQGDMGRLHGLLNDCDQVLTHLGQIHLITQGGIESGQRLGRVIFAAVEPDASLGRPLSNPIAEKFNPSSSYS